jgi:hypothetical protein
MKQSRGTRALVGTAAMIFADKYLCLVYYYYLLNHSGDQNPAGARFFAPVHIGHGTHPSSCKMSTVPLFRVKAAEA